MLAHCEHCTKFTLIKIGLVQDHLGRDGDFHRLHLLPDESHCVTGLHIPMGVHDRFK